MSGPEIVLVVAVADNGVMGADGAMPWHISADFRRVKALTMGKPLVMGRKTFDSLPGILPGRRHIVITRDAGWQAEGAERAASLEQALKLANAPHIVIFGGAEIYAAALPLAGLTAYRAVFSRAGLKAHERILIHGIGAGTALFALQFAVAAGAIPCVTSSAPWKLARAHELGSKAGSLYNLPDWHVEFGKHHGPFDVVVDSAAGPGFETLIDLTASGGRIVFFGATRGNPPELPTRKLFWRQISLLGTTMGSPADFAAMVAFVKAHALKPVVSEVFDLDHVGAAFERMERGEQFGKLVVRL